MNDERQEQAGPAEATSEPETGTEAGGDQAEAEEGGGEDRAGGWNPWASFENLQEAVSDMVDSALRTVTPGAARHPRYDMIDLPDEGYWILLDLPGLTRAEIEVTCAANELTVSGHRARPELPHGAEVQRSEGSYGRFRRTIALPGDVDPAGIKAKLENGVLKLTLPRRSRDAAQTVPVE